MAPCKDKAHLLETYPGLSASCGQGRWVSATATGLGMEGTWVTIGDMGSPPPTKGREGGRQPTNNGISVFPLCNVLLLMTDQLWHYNDNCSKALANPV